MTFPARCPPACTVLASARAHLRAATGAASSQRRDTSNVPADSSSARFDVQISKRLRGKTNRAVRAGSKGGSYELGSAPLLTHVTYCSRCLACSFETMQTPSGSGSANSTDGSLEVLLLPSNCCLQFLHLAVLLQKLIEQHRVHRFVADGLWFSLLVARDQLRADIEPRPRRSNQTRAPAKDRRLSCNGR